MGHIGSHIDITSGRQGLQAETLYNEPVLISAIGAETKK
jgi:hypothetical protein